MEKRRVEARGGGERGGGEACRFKVDESYRRKPIGRASISSNSATDPYPLFSHQRNTYRRIQPVSNPCASRVLARVRARAYTGEISALVCARSVWRRACTEHSQPLRNSAAFLFPRHAGQGRPTFSPDPPPIANRSNAITMRANFLDLFFFSDKTNL